METTGRSEQIFLDGAEPMCIFPDDPEVKKTSTMTSQPQECFSLSESLKYFSSWHRAKRAVAVCILLQKRYRTGSKEQSQVKVKESQTSIAKGKLEAHIPESKQKKLAS